VLSALLIVLFLGAALGVSTGLVGFGSVLAVPLLVYGASLEVHRAICLSMLTMTLLGFLGSIEKLHAGTMDLRGASVIAIFGALFAPLGAWLNKLLPHAVLLVLFALVVLAMSVRILLARDANEKGSHQPPAAATLRSSAAGAVIGLLGGLLGISGGFIAVPVLVTYRRLEIHRAVATSWAIVALVSAFATIGHFAAGQRVPAGETLLFMIGGVIGFEIAVRAAPRFSVAGLKRLFAAAILIMSVVMLLRLLASA
jgi:uncharacterized protein